MEDVWVEYNVRQNLTTGEVQTQIINLPPGVNVWQCMVEAADCAREKLGSDQGRRCPVCGKVVQRSVLLHIYLSANMHKDKRHLEFIESGGYERLRERLHAKN